ncbi:MAG: hypothetical protein ACXVVU_13105, partial [Solirubrobacteraceae bacterium]
MRGAPGRLAFLVGAVRAARRRPPPEQRPEADVDPSRRDVGADPRAEIAVAVLLVLAGLGAAAFAVLVAAYPQTQLLGAALGLGLACGAAALIVASKRVAPREVAVEEREPAGGEAGGLADDLRHGADGV